MEHQRSDQCPNPIRDKALTHGVACLLTVQFGLGYGEPRDLSSGRLRAGPVALAHGGDPPGSVARCEGKLVCTLPTRDGNRPHVPQAWLVGADDRGSAVLALPPCRRPRPGGRRLISYDDPPAIAVTARPAMISVSPAIRAGLTLS